MNDYYVYMLRCADGSFYIGVTNDLERRVGEHAFGTDPRSYTYERRPVELVYSSCFHEITDAIAWEKRIKGWSRKKKCALIEDDWERIRQLASRSKTPA